MKIEELSLAFTPEGPVVHQKVGDKIVVGYKAHDGSCDFDHNDWVIYAARRSATWRELSNFREALGLDSEYKRDLSVVPNKYAVQLDVYSHGCFIYSISGEGVQCQFDTAKGGAVWVPNDDLVVHLESMNNGFGALVEDLHEICRGCLQDYNAWNNGETYGVCVDTFDAAGVRVEEDAVWGFVGSSHADECLQQDYFNPAVAKLERELAA